ncbi:protein of unknown function [Serratia sp. Tan611]|nr:protein of unknown function [Serratia sp. Tan611]
MRAPVIADQSLAKRARKRLIAWLCN